ncbi:hypothetical protein GQ54DRAFT_118107 [Martensiomyces pterosporus]|nr:hypothetical protein GQ54DRAFT_118107 [Martensiomyces pterosporus]
MRWMKLKLLLLCGGLAARGLSRLLLGRPSARRHHGLPRPHMHMRARVREVVGLRCLGPRRSIPCLRGQVLVLWNRLPLLRHLLLRLLVTATRGVLVAWRVDSVLGLELLADKRAHQSDLALRCDNRRPWLGHRMGKRLLMRCICSILRVSSVLAIPQSLRHGQLFQAKLLIEAQLLEPKEVVAQIPHPANHSGHKRAFALQRRGVGGGCIRPSV